jgi:hypothetical protein
MRSGYRAAMRATLRLHPDSSSSAAKHVEVDVSRSRAGGLVLKYDVSGRIGGLRLPPVVTSAPADRLWLHTCFEVFIRAAAAPYYEFNFAPSTQWAAYRLASYRNGTGIADEISPPRIETHPDPGSYILQAAVDLDRMPGLPRDAVWHLGLSAVIEDTSGRQSYWALAHPPGKPDFHHPDCFACELPPA